MMTKPLPAAALLAVLMALGSPVPAQDASPAAALAALQFRDIDADGDRMASAAEFGSYGTLVMVSMDTDDSGDLDLKEFTSWGFGMQNLVDAAGTHAGYDIALAVIFDYWDRGNDARLSTEDLGAASTASFAAADASGDGALDEGEFRDNLLLNIALRAALEAMPKQ